MDELNAEDIKEKAVDPNYPFEMRETPNSDLVDTDARLHPKIWKLEDRVEGVIWNKEKIKRREFMSRAMEIHDAIKYLERNNEPIDTEDIVFNFDQPAYKKFHANTNSTSFYW